jgi:hypothetical protein
MNTDAICEHLRGLAENPRLAASTAHVLPSAVLRLSPSVLSILIMAPNLPGSEVCNIWGSVTDMGRPLYFLVGGL